MSDSGLAGPLSQWHDPAIAENLCIILEIINRTSSSQYLAIITKSISCHNYEINISITSFSELVQVRKTHLPTATTLKSANYRPLNNTYQCQ